MRTYTLRNDFHRTECRVRAEGLSHIYGECEIQLTEGQTRRARKALCGVADCTCAQHACGIRGPQTTDDGKRLIVDHMPRA
jgi:hypothetical protein